MSEEPNNQTPQNTPAPTQDQQPSANQPAENTGIPVKELEGKTPEEIIKIATEQAEKAGSATAELKAYKEWAEANAPYIDTIVQTPELLEKLKETHAKRTGQPAENKPQNEQNQPPPQDADTRKTLSDQIINGFEQRHGIDKLADDKRKEMYTRIGQEILEIYDPNGEKTYKQVIESIPLSKLDKAFEKAFNLATLDEQKEQMKQAGTNEASMAATGIMSSMPSAGGGSEEEVTMTPRDRELAKKMGISDDKWFQRKKEIIESYNK